MLWSSLEDQLAAHLNLQGVSNNYDTDLILPIVLEAALLAGLDYLVADVQTQTALRIIGDHTRAVVCLAILTPLQYSACGTCERMAESMCVQPSCGWLPSEMPLGQTDCCHAASPCMLLVEHASGHFVLDGSLRCTCCRTACCPAMWAAATS